MDQVSPALNEVQKVETTSWNSSSQSPTPAKSVGIACVSSPVGAEVYTVAIDTNPSCCTPSEHLSPRSSASGSSFDQAVNEETLSAHEDNINSSPKILQSSSLGREEDFGGASSSLHSFATGISIPRPTVSNSKITVTLEGEDLWHQFYSVGTEMIITKCGRRMFPGMVVSLAGLEANSKYTITMEINPADNHRYKFLNSKWTVVGKADAHSEEMMKYVHPDSPSSGKHWMATKVSFKKIKVTNNRNNKRGNVTLNSMHRYLPRIVISKYLSKKNSVIVHSQDFPECCFVAVTAYQNDQVTQLKIDHNPFAKAFRDNPTDPEFYGYGMVGMFSPSPSPLLPPYPGYSFEGQVPLQQGIASPGIQLPSHSPLPHFSSAFGSWETPPYSPAGCRPQGSTVVGPLASPATRAMPDHCQLLWNTSRLSMQESPPISPLFYSSNVYPTTNNQTGNSVYQFPGPITEGGQFKPPTILTSVASAPSQWQTDLYGNCNVSHSPVGYGSFQYPSSLKLPLPSHPSVPISPLALMPKVEAKPEGQIGQ